MRVSPLWSVVVLVGLAPACAAVWGFEDATLETDAGLGGGSSGGASDGSSGALDDGSSSGEAPPTVDTPIPEGCLTRTPVGTALYVDAQTGSDAAACSADAPCASIGHALSVAQGEPGIYVGLGTYTESFTVSPTLFGRDFFIEGRWERTAEGWKPYCVDDPAKLPSANVVGLATDTATIRAMAAAPNGDAGSSDASASDAGPAVRADGGVMADLVLSSLSLRGRESTRPNLSAYGIFARGIRLELRSVASVGGRGGDGADGAVPTPEATSLSCDGDGAAGISGGPTPPGVYTESGWASSMAPADPAATAGNYGTCGSGAAFTGTSPCKGGNGGVPGLSGEVGGGSFAVYAWNSELVVDADSRFNVIGGGRGGTGSGGGPQTPGQTSSCLGTPGGIGGPGGKGSPGAGGASFCLVLGGGSTITGNIDQSNCPRPGPGGVGGDQEKGLPGASGARVTSP